MASAASSGALRYRRGGVGKVTPVCAWAHLLAGNNLAADIEDDPGARHHTGGQVGGLAVVGRAGAVAELDLGFSVPDGHSRAGSAGHEGSGRYLCHTLAMKVKPDLNVEAGHQGVVMVGNVDLDAERSGANIDGTGGSGDPTVERPVLQIVHEDLHGRADLHRFRHSLRCVHEDANGIVLGHAIERGGSTRTAGCDEIAYVDPALHDRAGEGGADLLDLLGCRQPLDICLSKVDLGQGGAHLGFGALEARFLVFALLLGND